MNILENARLLLSYLSIFLDTIDNIDDVKEVLSVYHIHAELVKDHADAKHYAVLAELMWFSALDRIDEIAHAEE